MNKPASIWSVCYTLYTIFIFFGCFSQDNLVVFLCLNTTDLDTTNFFLFSGVVPTATVQFYLVP